MDRRSFLAGAAVAPVAVVAPALAVAAPPVPAAPAAVDGLCPIAWRALAHMMEKRDQCLFEIWKEAHKNEPFFGYVSALATTELMARRHPRWFISERLMSGPAGLVHGRLFDMEKADRIAICCRKDEVYRKEVLIEAPFWGETLLESIQDGMYMHRPDRQPFAPVLVGKIRHETEIAADKLNEMWEKGEKLGYVPFPYVPLVARLETQDNKRSLVFYSRYGIAMI